MFSAVKFMVAGVIVALFGGFLLAGGLTTQQSDEVVPAAASASPTAETEPPDTTQPPESPPSPMTAEELLSGMVTEEVDPGVYRVVNDGVRDLTSVKNWDVVAGRDGGIWVVRRDRFFRLGSDGLQAWASRKVGEGDFEVAPDDTIWVQAKGAIQSFDGEEWTTHHQAVGRATLEVTPDGKVWAFWPDPEQGNLPVVGYLDEDGWQALDHLDKVDSLHVASADDIWATAGETWTPYGLYRLVDGAWQSATTTVPHPNRQDLDELHPALTEQLRLSVGVGPDGTLWGVGTRGNDVARFDGSGWSRWNIPRETGWLWYAEQTVGNLAVAPDGSVWFVSRWGQKPECGGGVGHADGDRWDGYPRYLEDLCVDAIDITADGSVWLLAGKGSQEEEDAGPRSVYVITPEAVAAAE